MRVHISLDVASVERSTAFYRQLFGNDPSKTRDGYANFRLDEPSIHLALQEGRSPSRGGVSHLGIELQDDIALDHWRDRLKRTDVQFVPENKARCCYAKADKLWVTDPDGYRWEIWVRTGVHESMGATRKDIFEATETCC